MLYDVDISIEKWTHPLNFIKYPDINWIVYNRQKINQYYK